MQISFVCVDVTQNGKITQIKNEGKKVLVEYLYDGKQQR